MPIYWVPKNNKLREAVEEAIDAAFGYMTSEQIRRAADDERDSFVPREVYLDQADIKESQEIVEKIFRVDD